MKSNFMLKFKPMLCEVATMEQVEQGLFDDGVWTAQRKYDGLRAYAYMGRLYSRRGDDITQKFPEFKEFLEKMIEASSDVGGVFDGEIVAETNEFNDVSGRIHLKDKLFIKIASTSNPCKFVVFDRTLPINGDLQMQKTRDASVRISLLTKYEFDNIVPVNEFSNVPSELLEQAKREGWEGIVLKKKDSLYYNGRSFDWRKVKLWKETQHRFSYYEDHPKGILLKDGDRKVNINGKDSEVVKALINNKGSVVVEVQYLPQYNNDKWRFPSFRGVVTEVK